MAYPGIYRAKAVSVNGTKLAAFIPQVFGDVSVTVENFVGDIPITGQMGWVSFQGGSPEFPVWHGGGGGGGTVTDVVWVDPKEPTSAAMELWYDTDEEPPLDSRYLPSAGGVMTGHITLPSTDPPGTYSAVHHDWMMRWINLTNSATLAPAWIGLAYGSGWSTYDGTYMPGQYRKVGDTVQVRGLVKCASTAGLIATLPSGYRPPFNTIFTVWTAFNGSLKSAMRVDVMTTGAIQISGTSTSAQSGMTNAVLTSYTHLQLDGIHFSVTP